MPGRSTLSAATLLCIATAFFPVSTFAQCLTYPVSLEERIEGSRRICLGRVVSGVAYDGLNGQIYTLHTVQVQAWLKGASADQQTGVITAGGFLNDRGQVSTPSLQLAENAEYIFFLEADNLQIDYKAVRSERPGFGQARVYSESQGALSYRDGLYHDLYFPPTTEADIFQSVGALTGQTAIRPDGVLFTPRMFPPEAALNTVVITGFSPNPANAGTIVPADFLTITGSGFGPSPGWVEFKNADNGGVTFIEAALASDYVSWSDNSITVKVPYGGGTGRIKVNGVQSAGTLVVNYCHNPINSSFSNWGATMRQRYYHRNVNGAGGYTFKYNNTEPNPQASFSQNPDAVAAFERALATWRCESGINFVTGGPTTADAVAADGTSVLFFSASLPPGALGFTHNFFNREATADCDQENTVWWETECDIEFPNPPPGGFTWQFGPGAPASGQYDFETIALHELGHAHGLGHRIASSDLMHYTLPSASMRRTPAAHEVTGALARVTYSTAPTCFDPPGSGTPMLAVAPADCGQVALPVELLHFYAEIRPGSIRLHWATATERDNARFELERSTDGQTFSTIGHLPGSGFSNQEIHYRLDDENPWPGLAYYRLRQVDFDGKASLSSLVAVVFQNKTKGLRVWPNPASDQISVSGSRGTTLRLYDCLGREVRRQIVDGPATRFDLSGLAGGMYLVVDERGTERIQVFVGSGD